ncbi:ATP-binding cassette domain-containing protein [Anaerophaga thermohalophila]|uniref:ATP-binding cassette domain-containing protein n=1 Tax=Anaerophaga thermohalophila TaxID=177400 RepID=UPI0002E92972|nr:ATP-binding cassette domain-containing protein [Anaerophaga thermohalophila]
MDTLTEEKTGTYFASKAIRKTQPESAISIKNLNVFAGDHHILKNICLEIPKNKVTVLLGPSGCGKTTLLKSLNKLTDLYKELDVSGSVLSDRTIFLIPITTFRR